MTSAAKTSNFLTFTLATGGLPGTTASLFSANTEDDEATITLECIQDLLNPLGKEYRRFVVKYMINET